MEDQQKPTKKIALNYGLYLGIGSVLMSVILYAMGKHMDRSPIVMVIGLLLITVFIILGIREFKKQNGGFLSLGQGLKTGVGIALIGSLVSVVYTVIFAEFIEPDFVNQVVELQREQMLDNPNASEEQIEQMVNMTTNYFYVFTIGYILIINLFIGFIVSLIASLVMQQKENEY